jgi:hypothetical protein
MTKNTFRISYKLKGKEMPDIEASFPVDGEVNPNAYPMYVVEQIYNENIEIIGNFHPFDFHFVGEPWENNEPGYAPNIRQALESMEATDVCYFLDNKVIHL